MTLETFKFRRMGLLQFIVFAGAMTHQTGGIVPYGLMKIIPRDGRIRLAGKKQQKSNDNGYEDNKRKYAFHGTFYH